MSIEFIPWSSAVSLHFSRMNTNYRRGLWLNFPGNQTMCLKLAVSSFILNFPFSFVDFSTQVEYLFLVVKEDAFMLQWICIYMFPFNEYLAIFLYFVRKHSLQGDIVDSSYPFPQFRRSALFSKFLKASVEGTSDWYYVSKHLNF